MKKIIDYIILLVMAFVSSCNYLDIVPDEVVREEDTYQNEAFAKRYLYSCYGAVARRSELNNRIEWRSRGIELFTRDPHFSSTDYGPSNVEVNITTWRNVWDGIRLCYQFLDVVDKTPDITPENLKYFKAEAKFLIAYNHFISLQSYGPTCIIRKLIDSDTPLAEFPERSSYDEVVEFIDQMLNEALPDLADQWTGSDYGRATKGAVWAIKSRMRLYAASPLFNGNKMYADFKSKIDGRNLISQEYDPQKWEKAAEVSRKAIEETLKLGHHLYGDAEAGVPSAVKPGPVDPAQRRVRYCFMDDQNTCEILLAETRAETAYDIQNRSHPRWSVKPPTTVMNGCGPSIQMVEKFYTKNGLPMEYDKTFDYEHRYKVVDMPVNYDNNNYSDKSNGRTLNMHLNREPRFYAWIGFHNGFAETVKHNNKQVSNDNKKQVIILDFTKYGEQGIGNRTANFTPTGYLSKKFVHPRNEGNVVRYPFPVFRMAELYLNYAEALIEVGGDANLQLAKKQIDIVRQRAGLKSLDEAWNNYSTIPGFQNTQEGLRFIVRREREIEFYLETNHFWDSRRWVTTVKEELSVSNSHKFLNIQGETDDELLKVIDSNWPMYFSDAQYLMPIQNSEINKLSQLVQNPFYE